MFNSKPTIDGAIEHFVKGTATLRVVEANSAEASRDKTDQSEVLAAEARDDMDTATRAGRIADRLDELLA